ncbi:MAG: UDP-2,3-diacylglucosamine diphosphatase [Weeksellaceae bacterium]
MKRSVELIVVSDFHLGTYGCRAKELLSYLDSVQPKTLILNGDIIDMWQFKKSYFPVTHLKVLKKISNLVSEGTKVIYVTGNHDEMLRKFTDFEIGNFSLVNKVVLELDGKKAWVFHGDVFDASIQHSKWLAKLGGWGYDMLIMINNLINWGLLKMGREKYSLSKKIKQSVKNAVKYISDFEDTASELAIENGYDYVICGHIHQPQIREVKNKNGKTMYLNSGDWIESLSSLEYNHGEWKLFLYDTMKDQIQEIETPTALTDLDYNDLMENVIA